MHRIRRHLYCFVPAVFAVLVFSAYGYVLQGAHVLELYTKQLGKVDGLFVSIGVIPHDTYGKNGSVERDQYITYKHPDSYRSEIMAGQRKWVYVRSGNESVAVVDGRIARTAGTVFDRFPELLFAPSRKGLEAALLNLGVDVAVSSLGRFEGNIAYVVGAIYPDESRPQVWFDQKTFRPIRWLAPPSALSGDSAVLEILFSDWRQKGGTWFPMEIELKVDGETVREMKVKEITPGTELQPALFDIAHIRSSHPEGDDDAASTDEGAQGLGGVKDLIKDFKRIYQ